MLSQWGHPTSTLTSLHKWSWLFPLIQCFVTRISKSDQVVSAHLRDPHLHLGWYHLHSSMSLSIQQMPHCDSIVQSKYQSRLLYRLSSILSGRLWISKLGCELQEFLSEWGKEIQCQRNYLQLECVLWNLPKCSIPSLEVIGWAYLVHEHSIWSKDVGKDVFSHVRINCTQGIIQQIYIRIGVYRSCKTHSSFLATAEVYSLENYFIKLPNIIIIQ